MAAADADVPRFVRTGNLTRPRRSHTATLLGNGKVLVAGGLDPDYGWSNRADLYDPSTGLWQKTGDLRRQRYYHTATLLPNGKVLIAGGVGNLPIIAELYDPATGMWTETGTLNVPARYQHTATLLPNGKVLIAGGDGAPDGFHTSAELYDPATGVWTTTGSLAIGRREHTATLLANGKVLVTGGWDIDGNPLTSSELYDPATGLWTTTASMLVGRLDHTATLLSNGKVLVAGGVDPTFASTPTAELYDPAGAGGMGLWTPAVPLNTGRQYHTATLLTNGKVLVTGGYDENLNATASSEIYDPAGNFGVGSWTVIGNLSDARAFHTSILLADGRALITGGLGVTDYLKSAELYDPAIGSFASLSPNMMSAGRYRFTATSLPNGKVLVAGGDTGFGISSTGELFDPASGTFTSIPNGMTSRRCSHTATLLPTGKVLLAGGETFVDVTTIVLTNTAELFDPASETFTALPSMTSQRGFHTATLLANGKVLITGGYDNRTAELFDPGSGMFTPLPNMSVPRLSHTATLLPNGKVLIAGGSGASDTAELFDPDSGTFMPLPAMIVPRLYHTATLLPNGRVLIAGGIDNTQHRPNTAELFDPTTQTFISLSPSTMSVGRAEHTATLLTSGKVLLAGGDTASGTASTAELFDPDSGAFTSLSPNTLTRVRYGHTATLLATNKVLIAGGMNASNTAELFDEGLGFAESRRPVVSSAISSIAQPASLVLSGAGFRGDSEGSGSSTNNSATNYPLLQLIRVDNEQTFFALSDPTANWSDTAFSSDTLGAVTPLPTGCYRVTIFTNAIPSLQKIINIGAPPLQLVSAVSRKTHGAAGTFDIDLKPPAPGIECRAGGATGDHTVVVTFALPVTVSGNGTVKAQVTSGTGQVGTGGTANGNAVTVSGAVVTVPLTNVANAQRLSITIFGVSDGTNSGNVIVPMSVLLGDTSGNGLVNSTDVSQTQAQSGQAVTSSNFRTDVNANGLINSTDVSTVQAKSGTGLP